jgi:hypothetical protein
MVVNVRSMLPYFVIIAAVLVIGVMVMRRAGLITETVLLSGEPTAGAAAPERSLKIITLLPKDGIPAIFNPTFVSAEEGAGQLRDDDLVIGVSINGDHRAYGVPFLSSHEIVNDTVGGRPIAVTW